MCPRLVAYMTRVCVCSKPVKQAGSSWVRRRVEEVAGVQGIAATKRRSRAVQIVVPRFDPNVHHRAGLPAVLRLGVFLHVEFLDGVDGHDGGPIGEGTRCTGYGAGVKESEIDNSLQHPGGFVGPAAVGALSP